MDQSAIRSFSDFKIEAKRSFVGPSIQIESILDKEIIIEFFQIGPSTKKPGTECITFQLLVDGEVL